MSDHLDLPLLTDEERERFDDKVIVGKCHTWQGAKTPDGYGKMRIRGTLYLAHRLSYRLHVGPIPDDAQLDHACRTRHCVNPEHLRPVDNRTNTLLGKGPTARNARRLRCRSGHDLTNPDNVATYTDKHGTHRKCRACNRQRSRERRERLKASK